MCKPVSTATKVTGLGTTYDVPSGDDCFIASFLSCFIIFVHRVYVCMFSCASAYFVVGLQAVESARK